MQNIELNVLPGYDDRYRKPKIRASGDNVYTNFWGVNVSVDGVKCECRTIISVNFLLVYDNKFYLQLYLDNCAYKVVDKQKTGYLDGNLFEINEE